MKKIIKRHLQGKKVLSLFLLTNLVYVFMLMITIPRVMNFAGGTDILDMMPLGYAPFYVDLLFQDLGEQGRSAYLWSQIPVDMIYPLLFAISYCLIMAFFLKLINKLNSPLFYLCYLPIIAGLCDYLENIGIIFLLNTYPPVSPNLVRITSGFTLLKSGFTTVYFIALLIVLLIFLLRFLKRKISTT